MNCGDLKSWWEVRRGREEDIYFKLEAAIINQSALVSIKVTTVRQGVTDINGKFYLEKMCHVS